MGTLNSKDWESDRLINYMECRGFDRKTNRYTTTSKLFVKKEEDVSVVEENEENDNLQNLVDDL